MNLIFSTLLDKINLFVDMGIKIEINDYLKEIDNIKMYRIKEENEHYYTIEMELEDFSEENIDKSFEKFMRDMKYDYGTVFIKDIVNHICNYKFATFNREMKGFYCDIYYVKN